MAGGSTKHIASFSTDWIDQAIHRIIPDKNRRKEAQMATGKSFNFSVFRKPPPPGPPRVVGRSRGSPACLHACYFFCLNMGWGARWG